jgi:hypothetical protein
MPTLPQAGHAVAIAAASPVCYTGAMTDTPTQLDKFKQAARELETDDDPKRFKERLRQAVKHKPVEKPE